MATVEEQLLAHVNKLRQQIADSDQRTTKRFEEKVAEMNAKIDKLESQFERSKTFFVRICEQLENNWVRKPRPSTAEALLSSHPSQTLSQVLEECFPSEPDLHG
jgi:hypothetical protein